MDHLNVSTATGFHVLPHSCSHSKDRIKDETKTFIVSQVKYSKPKFMNESVTKHWK